jgi:hypothetical protein
MVVFCELMACVVSDCQGWTWTATFTGDHTAHELPSMSSFNRSGMFHQIVNASAKIVFMTLCNLGYFRRFTDLYGCLPLQDVPYLPKLQWSKSSRLKDVVGQFQEVGENIVFPLMSLLFRGHHVSTFLCCLHTISTWRYCKITGLQWMTSIWPFGLLIRQSQHMLCLIVV